MWPNLIIKLCIIKILSQESLGSNDSTGEYKLTFNEDSMPNFNNLLYKIKEEHLLIYGMKQVLG